MMKILITGGAGFIGSKVAEVCITQGHEVFIFDSFKQYIISDINLTPSLVRLKRIKNNINLIQGDTLHKDFLQRKLHEIKPDVIIHTAALPLANMAINYTEEAYQSILVSTMNIMDIMRDFKHRCRLVSFSSSMVYGDFTSPSYDELAQTQPKDIYGSFKLASEVVIKGYQQRYGLEINIVRPSAVYGPLDGNQRVLYKFITKALKGEPLCIEGDGSTKLDFTYIDDVAQAVFLVATKPNVVGEIFNVTRGVARSLHEAVNIIKSHVPGVNVQYKEMPDYLPNRGTLKIDKAVKQLGYQPKFDLEDGLAIYINHLKQHAI